MSRPRIIIADTDANYIIPLQAKFAESYFDRIDLEIITDRAYFEDFFGSPRHAEVMIVSEELYSSALQRHDISHIFIMTERQGARASEPNADVIFKYTSIKDIFTEITAKSSDVLRADGAKGRSAQIVAVYSACGGMGKTTLALGISAALAKNYQRVMYINAAHLQSFGHLLEDSSPISESSAYARLCAQSDDMYRALKGVMRSEGFTYLPPFCAAAASLGVKYSAFEKLALCAKNSGEQDFIIVDAESAFDGDKIRLLDIADRVIVLTDKSERSVRATDMLVSNVSGTDTDKFIFVCNESKADCTDAANPRGFEIGDTVGYIEGCDKMSAAQLADERDIMKVSLLII